MALARAAPPDAGGGFLDWWLGELRALLPHGWRQQKPRRFGVVLVLERPYVRVFERRGRKLAMLGSLVLADPDGATPAPTPEARLRRAIERHRDETVLVLGEQDALVCTDLLPAAAESDLARIMAHKLDLLTPWSAEHGYVAHKVLGRRRDGLLEVLVAAASRQQTDSLLRQLAGINIRPAAVDVALPGEGQGGAGIDLLQVGTSERRGPRLLAILVWVGLLALTGLVALIGWQIYERRALLREQNTIAAGLEERLSDLPDLRNRVAAMRAQARFLADDRSSRPSPLLVLEVLSRLLPDTVWLTEVTLDGNELSISGLADDASTLVPLIEGAPEFAQARFLSPSTRVTVRDASDTERQVERFALRAVVDPQMEPGL